MISIMMHYELWYSEKFKLYSMVPKGEDPELDDGNLVFEFEANDYLEAERIRNEYIDDT